MSKGLKLFANTSLESLSQVPESTTPTPATEELKPAVATETLTTNCNPQPVVPAQKPLTYTKYPLDENKNKYIIFANCGFCLQESQAIELVNMLLNCDASDEVLIYLPCEVSLYLAQSILNAAHRCKAAITVVGPQQLTPCATLLLLCGKIRTSAYDMWMLQPLNGGMFGTPTDVIDASAIFKQETNQIYQLLLDAGLFNQDEIKQIIDSQAQVVVYGKHLKERVDQYNALGYEKIHKLFM